STWWSGATRLVAHAGAPSTMVVADAAFVAPAHRAHQTAHLELEEGRERRAERDTDRLRERVRRGRCPQPVPGLPRGLGDAVGRRRAVAQPNLGKLKVLEEIVRTADQRRPLPDELERNLGQRAPDWTGDAEHLAPEVQG